VSKKSVLERLLAKTVLDDETGCWVWTGSLSYGYGQIGDESGRTRRAHVVGYELFVGAVPDGLQLDHVCRVTSCWAPWHVEPVTSRENVRRAAWPGGRCKRGHDVTIEGALFARSGGRFGCRLCRNEWTAVWRAAMEPERREAELVAMRERARVWRLRGGGSARVPDPNAAARARAWRERKRLEREREASDLRGAPDVCEGARA
jgi:hypothetical protein